MEILPTDDKRASCSYISSRASQPQMKKDNWSSQWRCFHWKQCVFWMDCLINKGECDLGEKPCCDKPQEFRRNHFWIMTPFLQKCNRLKDIASFNSCKTFANYRGDWKISKISVFMKQRDSMWLCRIILYRHSYRLFYMLSFYYILLILFRYSISFSIFLSIDFND